MKSKRAELTTEEIIQIVLVVAGIFLLLLLWFALLSPLWNQGDETAESYFEMLKEQIGVADSGGKGEFFIWPIQSEEDNTKYYLSYFGKKSSWSVKLEDGELIFTSGGDNKNHICICNSVAENLVCSYCENLDFPVRVEPMESSEQWFAGSGKKFVISKVEDYYEFKKI